MRAGPLSQEKVIDLLNRRFVPVYAVNEDYRDGGPATREEREEYRRIYHAALEAKLSTGTVHAYVLDPAGKPVGSLHVAEAARTEKLLALLEGTAGRVKGPEGDPLSPPRPQSRRPAAPEGGLVLHLLSRSDSRGSWAEFPAEDWIVLERAEAAKLLPPEGARPGSAWEVERALSEKLLARIYPQTENNNLSRIEFERVALRARVLSLADGRARVSLEGSLRRRHDFYPNRADGNAVEAEVAGVLEAEPGTGKVLSLRLATGKAVYGKANSFAAALRSEP